MSLDQIIIYVDASVRAAFGPDLRHTAMALPFMSTPVFAINFQHEIILSLVVDVVRVVRVAVRLAVCCRVDAASESPLGEPARRKRRAVVAPTEHRLDRSMPSKWTA